MAEARESRALDKRKRKGGKNRESEVYECPGCGRWHVTSMPTDANRRKRRKRNA